MIHIGSKNSNSVLSVLDEDMVAQNAVDIRIDKLFAINHESVFTIDEDQKVHRGSVEVQPDEDGYWTLQPNRTYEFLAEGTVAVGEDEAGFVISRSTFNRNGIFVTSGLYDSGYDGVMAGALHNNSGLARVKKGTRIGQFLLWKAEALSQYEGDYGTGKMDDTLYK